MQNDLPIVNDIITAAMKRAILLNAVGPAIFLKTLASPTLVTDLTFEYTHRACLKIFFEFLHGSI